MSVTAFNALNNVRDEFRQELAAIVNWWMNYSVDNEHGGFYGEVDANNQPVKSATKGIILNARILWFFSEVAARYYAENNTKASECVAVAKRAYDYILRYFFDAEHGGFYWELDAHGNPLNSKKQVYAQAFVIYALTAYYKLTKEHTVLAQALDCFALLESKTRDTHFGGYLEAFTREWGVLDDLRLSDKDLNFPKSQNTHLHILEAYTQLNKVHSHPVINAALRYNIELFNEHIIDKQSYHLRMFMDFNWADHSPGYTFGHDIEASWLIAQALDSLGDESYRKSLMPHLLKIAEVTLDEGRGDLGQVLDSYDFSKKEKRYDAVWWVQAEALVGFLFACSESRDPKYLEAATRIWEFIKLHQIDHIHGEWLWLSAINEQPTIANYKVGFWKCPYHNGRAMMEAIDYLSKCNIA